MGFTPGGAEPNVRGKLFSLVPTQTFMTPARKRHGSTSSPVLRQDTLRLSSSGVGMLLGDLEQRLMEAVWSMNRPATAREIHESLTRGKNIELITAVTVLNRLVKPKGLLKRKKMSDVFHYTATASREEFVTGASRHVAERVLALGSEAMTASIVDVLAERDPEQLAELGRLVRKKLREAEDR